jgi:cyclic-di-GMP-binding biofilm dispersal mediator protein
MDLKDKVVVIAGGSGVLGGAIARLLEDRGSKMLLAGRSQERLEDAARRLDGADTAQFDLRSPGSSRQLLDEAIDRFGRIDGLVNAAGVVAFGPIQDYPEDVIDDLISTNLLGPLHLMSAAVGRVGGFIVNISGVVAEEPFPGMAPYVASKAGLSSASRALGKELRREGVLVVDARPPHTETGLADRGIFGDPPRFREGLQPDVVALSIVEAIETDRREIPSASYGG